jgi:tetratricopeptide (TPR) repeat protein
MSVSPPATSTAAYEPAAANRPAGLDGIAAIGQALEREGRQQDARTLYESALHDRQAVSAAEAAQLVRWVARTYIQESALDAARDCAVAALAISEAAADEAGIGHAENILAIVEWKLSHLDEADRLFRRAHHSAHVAGETRLAAMTASNIGVIATVRGDDVAARLYFEAALRDARASA